jgi:hypothetical protein
MGDVGKYRIPYQQLAVIFIGAFATIWFFYPGCMSGDVLNSWNEALVQKDRTYFDMQPPMVAYIWHLLNILPINPTPQYANFFLLSTLLFWIGIVLAAQPWINVKWFWLLFCLGAGFFPPVFAILSQAPLKDAILCAALIAGYGGLVVAQIKTILFGVSLCYCLHVSRAWFSPQRRDCGGAAGPLGGERIE